MATNPTLSGIRGGRSIPPIVDEAKPERLGRAGGLFYIVHAGKEYALAGVVSSPEEAVDAALLVREAAMLTDSMSGQALTVGAQFRVAMEVEPGTFQRERDRRKRTPSRNRPSDALRGLVALRARPDWIAPGRGEPIANRLRDPSTAFEGEAPTVPGMKGSGGYVRGRPAVRGRAILELLASHGVELQARDGRLVPTSAKRITPALLTVVERAERLLLGYVSGHPLACELAHPGKPPEAVTLLTGGLAACADHLSGELDA